MSYHCLCSFSSLKELQWEILGFRASHGTQGKWDITFPGRKELPMLQGHEFRWWGGWGGERKNGRTSEQPAHTEIKPHSHPSRSGARMRAVEQRILKHFSPFHLLHHTGLPPVLPWALAQGCMSNSAEQCTRLPAAVWRGATACLFPGCLPALLLHASGFLAVAALVLLLLN